MVIKTHAQTSEQNTTLHSSETLVNEAQPLFPYSSSSSSTSPLIYVTDQKDDQNNPENSLITKDYEVFDGVDLDEINDTFTLFFNDIDIIHIPRKAERDLRRVVPKNYLKAIDKDKDIAVEKCLLMLSNLTSTIFSEERFKTLNSTLLHEQLQKGNDNTYVYPKIIKALKYSSHSTFGFIESKKNENKTDTYQVNFTSKAYSLTDTYYNVGLTEYKIKNEEIIARRRKHFYSQLNKAQENLIARNLITLYSKIDLPNNDDLLLEAKRLIKLKYTNRKGKILTLLNNHSKSYYKNSSKRSFVEENIKLYDFLTKRNYLIPSMGNEKSGGRVVDSFTLMPSWIRKLVKIDGENIVEVDFKALHPNIAMSLYNGSKKYLTHDLVAKESNIDIASVKMAHLSYFNKEVRDMKRSPLYNYYNEFEPEMNEGIIAEKLGSSKKHKITSMRMFAKEVEIMAECIKTLNAMGIYVGYVYDALFCKESDAEIVKKIMDEVVLEFGVYTTAKIS